MKTLLITGVLFVSGIWSTIVFQNDEIREEREYSHKWATTRTIDSLKRRIRMGPEPYCFHHRTYPPNAKDHDSIMRYLSHLTFREIREVKDGIKNDLFFIRFLDTLLMYKDSLQYALTGSRDFTLDD